MFIGWMNKGAPFFLPYRNFVLKHHVFLVRNWEKIRQKQEEVKHTSDNIHSASLYTRWNGICRDDGNIKSGKDQETFLLVFRYQPTITYPSQHYTSLSLL